MISFNGRGLDACTTRPPCCLRATAAVYIGSVRGIGHQLLGQNASWWPQRQRELLYRLARCGASGAAAAQNSPRSVPER